ncbi:RDD family protein [Leekyejoonella antrihumi]|uniref:RDD family protein n=2 Tax=Leekyejoonella antrihumi TaxID=1660198 RepID=A0A563DTF2_9MICO|nr:RDD family protein [Leekyejoonella antrihumi]
MPAQPRPLRGSQDVQLITGEAVLIDIPPAALPIRAVSGAIDLLVYSALLLGCLWFLATQLDSLNAASASALSLAATVLCIVVAPMTIETVTRGRTPGKLIMSLRTVRDDGGPIVFRHAFVRALVGVVEIFSFVGVPALIAALCTVRVKRLGDLAAGTYVVRIQRLGPLPPPPPMPTELIGWAQQCDIAPLPDGLALAIRQFLSRTGKLSLQGRASVSQSLLAQVAPLVSPGPPAGMHPEVILAAVLGERRRRDQLRLMRDDRLRARLLPPDRLTTPPATLRQ